MRYQDRRRFLFTVLGGTAASTVLPSSQISGQPSKSDHTLLRERLAAIDPTDERFWRVVKGQFSVRPDLILMNAANLCPSPYSVSATVQRLTADVNADASFQNRDKFGGLKEAGRARIAEYVGAAPAEIAITRNTSEGNNSVQNGLTLSEGDEVVIWDQNHPTNNVSWDVRAERYGFAVRRVSTPPVPTSSEELLQTFVNALTPRTRVLAFSHVSNISGVALPAKELCEMARERGILSLVDGAQTFGALKLNLHDMGCDFYTGSSHKWFVGPKEAGVLYVRHDRVDDLWPSNVGVGWASALESGAAKFENLGQRDDACVSAMGSAAEFHQTIGAEVVESRVRALAAYIKETIRGRFPNVVMRTPLEPGLSAGVVIFAFPGVNTRDLYDALHRDFGIGCAAMGGEFDGIRLSPHIYNTMEEVDRVVHALGQIV